MRPNNSALIAKAITSTRNNGSKVKQLNPNQVERELRALKITAIIEDAGIKIDPTLGPDSLSFYNPDAAGGVKESLARLVYDPSDNDPTLPWFGPNLSEEYAKSFIAKLRVPSFAKFFQDAAIEKLCKPNTQGMLRKDGSCNKDLSQISSPPSAPALSAMDVSRLEIAKDIICGKIVARLSDFKDGGLYSIVNGKVRLKPWTLEDFQDQMKKAIASSSPGYPYNGFNWKDTLDTGETVSERVYNDGIKVINGDLEGPFVFLQSARYTGDGDTEGSQRLVQEAPANEKLIGHILTYPLKRYIRYNGSGQLGIQQATVDIKAMVKGEYSNFRDGAPKPTGFMESDVSKWDAHIQDFQANLFFDIVETVYDMEDDFTSKVVNNYKRAFDARYLVTLMGGVFTRMLPSGSSITTAFAFIIHEIYILMADIMFCAPKVKTVKGYLASKKFGIVSLGLQGDDLWALVADLGVQEALAHVYSLFGCKMKEGSRCGTLDDPDACMVFLNELIVLNKDVPNIIIPKWNFFYSESADQNFRTLGIDRHLMAEVINKVAHPTTVELTFARFVGKLRRFIDSESFEFMMRKLFFLKDSQFKLRSWLGERVFSSDDRVVSYLRELEETHLPKEDQWPEDEEIRRGDRHECAWLTTNQLMSVAYISMLSAQDIDQRAFFKKMKAISLMAGSRGRSVRKIVNNLINSDNYNKLQDVRVTETEIESVMGFFEEAAQTAMSLFAEMSQPKITPDEAPLEVDQDSTKDVRVAPTIQACTNIVISSSIVDPYEVSKEAIKLAHRLWVKYRSEGNDVKEYLVVMKVAELLEIENAQADAFLNSLVIK